MVKLCLRTLTVCSLLLSGMFLAQMASAHVIKHHHPEPQYHQVQPTIIQLMIKALHAPAPQPEPHKHVHTPTYHPAPAPSPVSVMKVHADMCVKGTSWLNARSGPSTNHRVLAELAEGQRIHITTCQPSSNGKIYWCKTDLGYGKTAFVSKKYLAACELTYRNHKW